MVAFVSIFQFFENRKHHKKSLLFLLQQAPRKYGTESEILYIRLQKTELAEHGISCEGKRAVQLKKSDYDKYDMFICMDERNFINTMRFFGDDSDNKVRKLLKNKDVSDPWYTDRFDIAYNDIYKGCKNLLEELW